jgi:hypothetical protein
MIIISSIYLKGSVSGLASNRFLKKKLCKVFSAGLWKFLPGWKGGEKRISKQMQNLLSAESSQFVLNSLLLCVNFWLASEYYPMYIKMFKVTFLIIPLSLSHFLHCPPRIGYTGKSTMRGFRNNFQDHSQHSECYIAKIAVVMKVIKRFATKIQQRSYSNSLETIREQKSTYLVLVVIYCDAMPSVTKA